jgi:cobalt/nickel transport system permease protein
MHKKLLIPIATLALLALWPSPADAMHITGGILPAGWALTWFIVAAPFLAWGLFTIKRRSRADSKYPARVALVGAAVFVISCMPIPLPVIGSCSHPCGVALGMMLIGPAATIVVATIALILQATFLAHGGFDTLGANVMSMGIVGTLTAWAVYRGLLTIRMPVLIAAFIAALASDWATYTATAAELSAGLCGAHSFGSIFLTAIIVFIPTQVPLGVLEGVLTAAAWRFVAERRPDLLETLAVAPLAAAKEQA